MTEKILCVDDDPNVLAAHERNLRKHFVIETASSPELGLVALRERGPFAVILSDMRMPGMDGVQFLSKAREIAPDTVRTMLTGNNDQLTAVQAVNEGNVFRFITKPCPSEQLIQILNAALRQYQLITAEREVLAQTLGGSIKLLTNILSITDPHAFGQAQILKEYARTYLHAAPQADSLWEIELAAMLLNLGCVSIPSGLLEKARAKEDLTENEKAIMERMPEMGYSLLSNIPRLQGVAQIVHYQNKNYDGTGFPHDDLKGSAIPFGSRLLKVLGDLLEAESLGMSRPLVFAKMQKERHRYDPEILSRSTQKGIVPPLKLDEAIDRNISLKELCIKDVLLTPLTSTDGLLLIPKGTEVSSFILQKIRNYESLGVLNTSVQIRVTRFGFSRGAR
jgi:response regulator RpfG family c-di-GMP phosphodiesterase